MLGCAVVSINFFAFCIFMSSTPGAVCSHFIAVAIAENLPAPPATLFDFRRIPVAAGVLLEAIAIDFL